MPKVLVICGATASGKTALSVACAKQLNTEIISADSLLVYRLVPIETADTLYEGLEMVVRVDSLDSLDSLSVCDSIVTPKVVRTEVGDSLLKRKMLSDNKKLWQLSE